MDKLMKSLPLGWKDLKRFLHRAAELQKKDPVVAFFLCSHVLHLAIQRRRKDKDNSSSERKEEDIYLNLLVTSIETEKKRLGEQLEGIDGRTVLTKVGLELFNRADERQRAGECDATLILQFFTAATLLEATSQFTKDHKMDAVAAERCRYAQYMGFSLDKKLGHGKSSLATTSDAECKNMNCSALPSFTSPALSLSASPTNVHLLNHKTEPSLPAPQEQQLRRRRSPTTTPSASAVGGTPDSVSPEASPSRLAQKTSANGRIEEWRGGSVSGANSEITDPESPIPGGNGRATLNDLLKAQQHAKKGVNALQFLDYPEAIRQLRSALQILEQ